MFSEIPFILVTGYFASFSASLQLNDNEYKKRSVAL